MSYEVVNKELTAWADSYTGPKFHAVLCDPPYGLSFMGAAWDKSTNFKAWGEALLTVLHPGAVVLAFGGTRTWHRLACGFEDAGLQLWDTLMWFYGTGFPKGQDISKLIDKKLLTAPGSALSAPWTGHKTCALKPAYEPILAFRAPSSQTYSEMALQHGAGCLNIAGTRVEYTPDSDEASATPQIGRYPANVILDEASGSALDSQTGEVGGGFGTANRAEGKGRYGKFAGAPTRKVVGFGDSGGASRFFYCKKASTRERCAGMDTENDHLTVKPLELIRWLATLLLPPDSVQPRRLLVPFSGSGSEMIGAVLSGWDEVVGIEKDQHYCDVAEKRISYWVGKEIA